MFKLLAVLALMFCTYLALLTWAPPAVMLEGFTIAGHWIAYWWCAILVFGWVAWRAI